MSSTIAGSLGTAGQGHDGGSSVAWVSGPTTQMCGGGGGGAGTNGVNATSYFPGNGGDGLNYTINGSNVYYAGGGGGGYYTSATTGKGGNGGGGNGGQGNPQNGFNASANTGGGGGGAGALDTGSANGGSGGSGIVIVRYLTPTATTEQNNSYKNQSFVYAEVSVNDTNFENLTIGIYNDSWSNVTNYTSSSVTINWTELGEGVYYYNASAYDSFGNYNQTETRKITLDRTTPNGTLISPANNTPTANNSNNFTANISDNLGIANASLYVDGVLNSTITFVDGTLEATIGIVVTLVDGIYNWFYSLFDWAGNQFQTENNTLTIDTIAPTIGSISYTPNSTDDLDPLSNITFTVNVSDNLVGTDSVILQIDNGTGAWENYTMSNISGDSLSGIYSYNLTLDQTDNNYTMRVWANDSLGTANSSANSSFAANWDCTWNVVTTGIDYNLGSTGGFNQLLELGNITFSNTGDSNYAINNCSITFARTAAGNDWYDGTDGYDLNGEYLNFTGAYYLKSGTKGLHYLINETGSSVGSIVVNSSENLILTVTGGFPRSAGVLTERIYFPIFSSINNTETGASNVTISASMIITAGAYLENAIESPSSDPYLIDLTPGNHSFIAYVKDVVSNSTNANNTAYDVSFNWTLPSEITSLFTYDNLSANYTVLNDTTKQYLNLTMGLTAVNLAALSQTNYTLTTYAFGYENSTGNLTLINHTSGQVLSATKNIRFQCYFPKDEVVIPACGELDGDVAPTDSGSAGSSGGGGGGGGSGGGSFDKSSATFSLIRGDKQEFELVLENKLDSPKKNIAISISGDNSQYVSVEPKVIDYVAGKSSKTVTVKIVAPSYFTSGKFLLQFQFSGTIQGNVSTPFTEVKYVTLEILEMSRADADKLVNGSSELLDKMNSSGFYLVEVQKLLDSMNNEYANLKFNNLKDLNKQVNDIYVAVTESVKLLYELNQSIIEAEKNGVTVYETRKLLYMARIIFDRGDYIAAYAKLEEAKSSFLLETKGEYNLYYVIKNNPLESLGILISLSLIGLGSGYLIRLGLLKRKLRILGEEEVLLLQLMRVIQRDCFEGNKMSMEEYEEAMIQYESRLSKVIQEKIKTETQIANINKLSGKKSALKQEKDRLITLVKQTQDDYMNKGKLDTRVYENMLRTYATRLSKIQEELAYMEAEEELKKVTGFWKRWL